MAVRIYFSYRNQQVLMLPVNPEEFTVEGPGNNSTENIVGTGDVNILKLPGLRKIKFKAWVPSYNTSAGYIVRGAPVLSPDRYIEWFQMVRGSKEAVTLVVTDLNVTLQVAIESFDYAWKGGDDDMHYTLSLREWKPFEAKVIEVPKEEPAPVVDPAPPQNTPPRENTPKTPTVGATVIVNGRLHRDSYGSGPGATEKDAKRKISHIASGRAYPYHVTTLDGGWRGWVAESAVQVV